MRIKFSHYVCISLCLLLFSCASVDDLELKTQSEWTLIDNFENSNAIQQWTLLDTKNDTKPKIENPQITEVRSDVGNSYLIKKPAADGVVGNRKALSFRQLPRVVPVGKVHTFYARFQVEYFPNNHVFGLSNLSPKGIEEHDYNAFEPSIRITDKAESNGYKNDGTLMVRQGKGYEKIVNLESGEVAQPLEQGIWYELWYVVNNKVVADGGQTYDVYLKGGEFKQQTPVYQNADFRMKREKPLAYLLLNCNTGPQNAPYGNGGILYDDFYSSVGENLSKPSFN